MATWRGSILEAVEIVGRRRIRGFKILVRFEVLDPGVVHRVDEAWDYDIDWFDGLTLAQIRTLVLDQGGPVKEVGPPAPPGTFTAPSPPPLRERGAAIFLEWEQATGARVLLDNATFPTVIPVVP